MLCSLMFLHFRLPDDCYSVSLFLEIYCVDIHSVDTDLSNKSQTFISIRIMNDLE